MSSGSSPNRNRLFIPPLAAVYGRLWDFSELLLRVSAGLALVAHGYPKIIDRLARVDLVEGRGSTRA